MIPLVATVLGASLVGSPHCVAMCGGFVCFAAGAREGRAWPALAGYHGGRLVSYALLGALAGAIGAGFRHAGAMAGVQDGAALASGALLIASGGAGLAAALGARVPGLHGPGRLRAVLARALRVAAPWPPAARALAMGLVTTLLPCGWLWAFVATAAGAGTPWGGALVMAAFWAGTLPAMTGVALVARAALGPLARRLPALTAALLLAIGLLTIAGKLRPDVAAADAHHAEAAHDCH